MAEQDPQNCASQLYKLLVQDDEGKKQLPSSTNKILKKTHALNTKFLPFFFAVVLQTS